MIINHLMVLQYMAEKIFDLCNKLHFFVIAQLILQKSQVFPTVRLKKTRSKNSGLFILTDCFIYNVANNTLSLVFVHLNGDITMFAIN